MLRELGLCRRGLYNRSVRSEISIENSGASALHKRIGPFPDYVRIVESSSFDVFPHGLAVDRYALEMKKVRNLKHQCSKPARIIEVLHEEGSGRTNVGQHRHTPGD